MCYLRICGCNTNRPVELVLRSADERKRLGAHTFLLIPLDQIFHSEVGAGAGAPASVD